MLGGTLYDLRNRADRLSLGFQAVQSEDQAEYIRENVKRGIDGAAVAGRPHGKLTYGYRRVYDQRTRAFLAQEPDIELRLAVAADGGESEYSRAGIVAEIFDRIDAGIPLIRIEQDLNARGVPASQGGRWLRGIIRKMAMNPAYIGKRVLRGEIVGDGVWPALVSEDVYWSVQRLLTEPERKTTRPSRAVWLLSYLARCGRCDGPLWAAAVKRNAVAIPRDGLVMLFLCQCHAHSGIALAEVCVQDEEEPLLAVADLQDRSGVDRSMNRFGTRRPVR